MINNHGFEVVLRYALSHIIVSIVKIIIIISLNVVMIFSFFFITIATSAG